MTDVVCVGDLLRECIVPWSQRVDATTIVRNDQIALGGSAYNICWYLSQFGLDPILATPCARNQASLMKASFLSASQRRGVAWTSGDIDLLVSFVAPDSHRSVCLVGEVREGTARKLLTIARRAKVAIVTGGRHRRLRRMFADLARADAGRPLIFNPSYAVFEYDRMELEPLLRKSSVVMLNEDEVRRLCSVMGTDERRPASLVQFVPGMVIVTYGDRGAVAYQGSNTYRVTSLSKVRGDVIGAGDAFLAGYLWASWRGRPALQALWIGAAAAGIVADKGQTRSRITRREVERRAADTNRGSQLECLSDVDAVAAKA